MRAIRIHEFGEPEVMEVVEIPGPEPGPGQVVVRVHAAGVNPVDTYLRSGLYTITPPLPTRPVRTQVARSKRSARASRAYRRGIACIRRGP